MARVKPQFAVVGGLREDYFITPLNEVHLREIGGNAVYAAVGAFLWNKHIALIARVGENYPTQWIELFKSRRFDTRGIQAVPGWHDTRTFYAYLSLEERADTDPAGHFARQKGIEAAHDTLHLALQRRLHVTHRRIARDRLDSCSSQSFRHGAMRNIVAGGKMQTAYGVQAVRYVARAHGQLAESRAIILAFS